MIALTPNELMALIAARGTPPGIRTVQDPTTGLLVLDEEEWAKHNNGPLPDAAEIAAAVAAYSPPPPQRDPLAEIDALKVKMATAEAEIEMLRAR